MKRPPFRHQTLPAVGWELKFSSLVELLVDKVELLVDEVELLVNEVELLVDEVELLVDEVELLAGKLPLLLQCVFKRLIRPNKVNVAFTIYGLKFLVGRSGNNVCFLSLFTLVLKLKM